MKIGIIGPCENEIVPFIESMENVTKQKLAMLTFYSGTYSSVDIVALFCGVCKVNAAVAAQILIDKYDVTQIIVTGVAGAIDEKLKIFDTVIASEAAYHDVSEGILTQYHPWMETVYFKADRELLSQMMKVFYGDETVFLGRVVTGEAFISQDGREEIIEAHAPLCVDMETAAIAHVCHVNGIPFIAVRSISDTPHESGSKAFEKHCGQAALKSLGIVKKYLDSLSRAI